MTPIVNGLEDEFANQITILRLNADESENVRLMQEYGLRGHPSFVLLDQDGRVVQTFFGPQSEDVLRETIYTMLP